MKKIYITVWVGLLAVSGVIAAPVTVKSPDGKTSASFEINDGKLSYEVSRDDKPVVVSSSLEIMAGAKMGLVDQSVSENDTSWKPVWGQFSTIRDQHNELTLSLTADGLPVKLLCRVFDTGLGFRFELSEESKGKKLAFSNGCVFPENQGYYYPRGERGVAGPLDRSALKAVSVPLVLERGDASAVALIESDLYSAAGFEAMRIQFDQKTKSFVSTNSAVSNGAGQVTPWRVVLIEKSIGDLTVNTVALNLAAPCKLKDTSWIKPGKGLWDWRVHGYDNGDFPYGIDTRSFLRYINFCADQGVEYFTIDDHWFKSAKDGKLEVAPEVDIAKVMAYAKEKSVKIMLYYDRKKGDFGDEKLFGHYAGLGASGIKYGFMGNKGDFTRNSIEAAAENRLLVNFHDGPVPMTGVERTMPNLISREYCHGQQDSRRAFTPETFLKMAMVNALTGPLDMSNGNFGIKSINTGEREKGPKKKNSYISTVVSECARCLVISSGLVTLPDAPEEYLKKADLFGFLKAMPATWDDSRAVNSKIGEYITIARRSGDVWFVASVNNEEARSLDVNLDFLESGKNYEATIYHDAADSHGVKNPEAYTIITSTVMKGDVIPAKMAVGGGHAMILRPVK